MFLAKAAYVRRVTQKSQEYVSSRMVKRTVEHKTRVLSSKTSALLLQFNIEMAMHRVEGKPAPELITHARKIACAFLFSFVSSIKMFYVFFILARHNPLLRRMLVNKLSQSWNRINSLGT